MAVGTPWRHHLLLYTKSSLHACCRKVCNIHAYVLALMHCQDSFVKDVSLCHYHDEPCLSECLFALVAFSNKVGVTSAGCWAGRPADRTEAEESGALADVQQAVSGLPVVSLPRLEARAALADSSACHAQVIVWLALWNAKALLTT